MSLTKISVCDDEQTEQNFALSQLWHSEVRAAVRPGRCNQIRHWKSG